MKPTEVKAVSEAQANKARGENLKSEFVKNQVTYNVERVFADSSNIKDIVYEMMLREIYSNTLLTNTPSAVYNN